MLKLCKNPDNWNSLYNCFKIYSSKWNQAVLESVSKNSLSFLLHTRPQIAISCCVLEGASPVMVSNDPEISRFHAAIMYALYLVNKDKTSLPVCFWEFSPTHSFRLHSERRVRWLSKNFSAQVSLTKITLLCVSVPTKQHCFVRCSVYNFDPVRNRIVIMLHLLVSVF